MFRFLLFAISLSAYADSVAVEITADRHAIVQEHYSAGTKEFVYLASACARVERIHLADGRALESAGAGPWVNVSMPSTGAVDLSYETVPTSASPRECAVPVLMPKHPVESVAITITDRGSNLTRVSEPHFMAHPELRSWTATFPAVPSHVQLEWETGSAPARAPAGPTGLFAWNFWGLVTILVTWTFAYLLWARRQTS